MNHNIIIVQGTEWSANMLADAMYIIPVYKNMTTGEIASLDDSGPVSDDANYGLKALIWLADNNLFIVDSDNLFITRNNPIYNTVRQVLFGNKPDGLKPVRIFMDLSPLVAETAFDGSSGYEQVLLDIAWYEDLKMWYKSLSNATEYNSLRLNERYSKLNPIWSLMTSDKDAFKKSPDDINYQMVAACRLEAMKMLHNELIEFAGDK